MILLWALESDDVRRTLNFENFDHVVTAEHEIFGMDKDGNFLDKNGEVISPALLSSSDAESPAVTDSRSSSEQSVEGWKNFSIPPKFSRNPLRDFYMRPENRHKYVEGWLCKSTGIFLQSDPTGSQYADENCRGGGVFISGPVDHARYIRARYPTAEYLRASLPR